MYTVLLTMLINISSAGYICKTPELNCSKEKNAKDSVYYKLNVCIMDWHQSSAWVNESKNSIYYKPSPLPSSANGNCSSLSKAFIDSVQKLYDCQLKVKKNLDAKTGVINKLSTYCVKEN